MREGSPVGGRPPVNEVVLSVAIAPQYVITGPRIPEIFGSWYDEHKNVQVVPQYTMPPEAPLGSVGLFDSGAQFFPLALRSDPRYWLLSANENEIIQVQPDYLALNWKRGRDEGDYVRYTTLRERFISLLGDVTAGLRRVGGDLNANRAEITYVNVLEPGELWSELSDLHRLFRFSFPRVEQYERLSFNFSEAMSDEGGFLGRLHVSAQPVTEFLKPESRINLTISARSILFPEPSTDRALAFLDRAHARANEIFKSIITDEALMYWGIS